MKILKINSLTKKQKKKISFFAKKHSLIGRNTQDIEKNGYVLTKNFKSVFDEMDYLYTDDLENPSYVIIFFTNNSAYKKYSKLPKYIEKSKKKNNHSYLVFSGQRKSNVSYTSFLESVFYREAELGNDFFWVLIGESPYRNLKSEQLHLGFGFKKFEEIKIKIGGIYTTWGVYIKKLDKYRVRV